MDLSKLPKIIEGISLDTVEELKKQVTEAKQVYMLGNGGSSAVCSHIAQDYSKMLGKRAWTFDNASQLTCYSNDFGQIKAYLKWLEHMVDKDGALVILISSSGESENILHCARWCENEGIPFIILSGFDEDNSLRRSFNNIAKLEYWVDSHDYGIVECVHQLFLHSII